MKNIEITYCPKASGFIRIYGPGAGHLGDDVTKPVFWYDWILFIYKFCFVKTGNKKHRISMVDYNITPKEFLCKVHRFIRYRIIYPLRIKLKI